MGPKPRTAKSPSDRLRLRSNLRAAWQTIYGNGIRSSSQETKDQIKQFARAAETAIERIQKQLRSGTFKFRPARGITLKKKNGRDKRGIVLFSVEDRIVQRALLNVIQDIPAIRAQLQTGLNFGGIKGKDFGVPAAVEKALEAAQQNAYYIRTDISRFFDSIPRRRALDALAMHIADAPFVELLHEAANVELDNLQGLGPGEAKLFPLGDKGVAQGSCLSPLLCNVLLAPLDKQMDGRGITWIRYIDDFVLFSDSRERAHKALTSARRQLKALGLDAYSPDERPDKAEQGPTKFGFTFLGCDIRPDRVRPSQAARDKLVQRVQGLLNETLSELRDPEAAARKGLSVSQAIIDTRNIIQGWGNTYSFCTDDHLMAEVDRRISAIVSGFLVQAKHRIAGLSETERHRALGIHLLTDCRTDGEHERCRRLVSRWKAPDGAAVSARP